jgi:hypothetical protein
MLPATLIMYFCHFFLFLSGVNAIVQWISLIVVLNLRAVIYFPGDTAFLCDKLVMLG